MVHPFAILFANKEGRGKLPASSRREDSMNQPRLQKAIHYAGRLPSRLRTENDTGFEVGCQPVRGDVGGAQEQFFLVDTDDFGVQ
jgi:hypothetical protein